MNKDKPLTPRQWDMLRAIADGELLTYNPATDTYRLNGEKISAVLCDNLINQGHLELIYGAKRLNLTEKGSNAAAGPRPKFNPRRAKSPQGVNFYLGDKTKAAERKVKLIGIAHDLGFANPSELLQAIADGDLKVNKA